MFHLTPCTVLTKLEQFFLKFFPYTIFNISGVHFRPIFPCAAYAGVASIHLERRLRGEPSSVPDLKYVCWHFSDILHQTRFNAAFDR